MSVQIKKNYYKQFILLKSIHTVDVEFVKIRIDPFCTIVRSLFGG